MAECPSTYTGDDSKDDTKRYVLEAEAAQNLIDRPKDEAEVIADLRADLRSHFKLMLCHDLERNLASRDELPHTRGRQAVARSVRGAALAAFMHISATDNARILETYDALAADGKTAEFAGWEGAASRRPFRHVRYETRVLQQFGSTLSETLLTGQRRTLREMTQPDGALADYRSLALHLPKLLGNYRRAVEAGSGNRQYPTPGLGKFLRGLSQDNASVVAEQLIALEAARSAVYGYDASSPQLMMDFAITNRRQLRRSASVNRTVSVKASPYCEEPRPGYAFGRRLIAVAFETAVQEGATLQTRSLYEVDGDGNLGLQSPLDTTPWRYPGHCVAYPELASYTNKELRFSVVEVAVALGAYIAKDTIYCDWPGIEKANR